MDAAVIVVGAGPAGLMLAGELRLAGVDVLVLERLDEPRTTSKGLGFTVRAMEVFDQRGLLPRFADLPTSDQGHFGGIPLDLGVLDGRHQANRTVSQFRIETVLSQWATELGAVIRRGHQVLSLAQHGSGVEVAVRGPAGEHRLRCAYVVGCDGVRSTVRDASGFATTDTPASREVLVAEVRGVRTAGRAMGESYPGGTVMSGEVAEGVTRLVIAERDARPRRRTAPPPYAEVAAAWQRVTGEDVSSGIPVWADASDDGTRHATRYRQNRVLLAGHAAHAHVSGGPQGMHTGIQDSVNLGWKLAAVVGGAAPDRLLDTYHDERHPVGRRLLTSVQAQWLLIFRRDELAPLRDVLGELTAHETVNRHLARRVSGLDIRYDVGPGGHPLLGARMPHQELVRGEAKTSTTELLHPARGVVLDCADDAALRRAAEPWADRVDTVTAVPHGSGPDSPLAGTRAVLIRPDGHVAWTPESQERLSAALERWFGRAAA